MRPEDISFAKQIAGRLANFSQKIRPLPGVNNPQCSDAYLEQIVESTRRIRFVKLMLQRPISEVRGNPSNSVFDPLKAAILHLRQGNYDEACWLVFLSVHFGKHLRDGWRLTRDIYRGNSADGAYWTWARASSSPANFRDWLKENEGRLRSDGIPRRFGNHRKYETLSTESQRGTAQVFESYSHWIGANRGHKLFFEEVGALSAKDPKKFFHELYEQMNVTSFGRTGKFDYLTMLGKLEVLPIEPGSPYLVGATGPLRGARLLFDGNAESISKALDLEPLVVELGNHLNVGMQVMEDSLCNWQKSPEKFIAFRG